MKKFLIFVCSLLLFTILTIQVADYIFYRINVNTVSPVQSPSVVEDDSIPISISAVGDCFFGTDTKALGSGSFEAIFKDIEYDYTYPFKKVKKYFEQDDLTVINYEGAISDNGTRAEKEFAFRSRPEYVNILTEGSVEVANLSNNHTRDYGETARNDTKQILSENGIATFTGSDVTIVEKSGIKIGFIGTSALRYSEKSAFLDNLNLLKEQNPDLIVAVFHWGIERETTPTNEQTQLAHTAIDNGADLVIGHHPHVLQGVEKYKGKYILYSLGNFAFGGNKNPSDKDTMIFNQVFYFKDGKLTDKEDVSIIPCLISSAEKGNNYQPTPLSGEEFTRVKNKILDLSSNFDGIENIRFIEDK